MLETNFKQYKPYFELIDQLFEIERKLGIQINDQAWERIESVRELLQAIKDQQQIV